MRSSGNSDKKEYICLAAKVLSEAASAEEKSELDRYVQGNKDFQKTVDHMRLLFESKKDEEFLQTVLRVIFGFASPREA